MQMDDMILVSIDDHMVEPPDMYENHVPAKWQDQVPKVVRNDAGHRRVGVPGREDLDAVRHGRHRRLAARGVGLQPRLVLRAAPRLLRRPRAGARHERQRRARVDELPDDGGVQRPHVHRGAATRSCRSSCCRPTTTGPSTSGAAPTPAGSSRWASSRCGTSTSRSRRCTASARRAAARSASSRRRTCRASRASCPATGTRCSQAMCDENMVLSLHIGAGFDVIQTAAGGADRPPHGARVPDQRHHRAGPALRADAAPVPRPEGRALRGRDRLDPVLLRPRSTATSRTRRGCTTATTSAASCRPRCSASTSSPATSPTRRACELRDRIGIDIIAWECDYPHTDTTWPESPEFAWKELQDAGCTDDEIHKITWENACRFFDWDPFEHTPKEQATVGALRALADRRRHHPHVHAPSGASATKPPASACSERTPAQWTSSRSTTGTTSRSAYGGGRRRTPLASS